MTHAPKALLTRAMPFARALDDDGDGFTLEGYAAVFNSPARIDSWEGVFDEVIVPGAFRKTLQERTPVMQFEHGHDVATGAVPIGVVTAIREDHRGLFVRARLHDNPRVEPIRQAIESGALNGMSFRFRVTREDWDESGDVPLRTIREVDLFEVGPVVWPAYTATSVGVRSLLAGLADDERAELIRELGGPPLPGAPDAARESTSRAPEPDDAAPVSTSSPHIRAAFLRHLHLARSTT